MGRYVILSEKVWHKILFENLKQQFLNDEWILIDSKFQFNLDYIRELNPLKIFIPHWSYLIPQSIFASFECIVFHMTDLPFGRGGSPLQNLIVRGFKETKISAIKVDSGLDTGDIYIKKNLSLSGTAKEIFISAVPIIESMIVEIILCDLKPFPQSGNVVEFKRRLPKDGDIFNIEDLEVIYDYIRMLDCDGYPNAFIENNSIKIEFNNAEFKSNNCLTANVRIFKK